jgi:hypothetical protein
MFNLYNFVAYQIAWFAAILGAAHGHAWAGIAVALLVTGAHLWLRAQALEFRLVIAAAFMGIVVDNLLVATSQVRFASAGGLPFAPLWMLGLWIAFATTLNHSMLWLMRRPWTAALGGAIFGPLAYLAGEKLGALTLPTPVTSLPLLAVLWTAVMVVFSLMLRPAALPAARSMTT